MSGIWALYPIHPVMIWPLLLTTSELVLNTNPRRINATTHMSWRVAWGTVVIARQTRGLATTTIFLTQKLAF
jgi:hypothetical protein